MPIIVAMPAELATFVATASPASAGVDPSAVRAVLDVVARVLRSLTPVQRSAIRGIAVGPDGVTLCLHGDGDLLQMPMHGDDVMAGLWPIPTLRALVEELTR